jgi:hypothetical protein
MICWDRGRSARKRTAGAQALGISFSRFALAAGGTPTVPASRFTVTALQIQAGSLTENTAPPSFPFAAVNVPPC